MSLATRFKGICKWLLRRPADLLLASSTNFPRRVEECLAASAALAEVIDTRLDDARDQQPEPAPEPLVPEATGPYPHYVQQARELGMDVNDYFEKVLGNGSVVPFLELFIFPHLRDDSVVCELGPATGVYSREVLKRLGRGELHLVDCSPWFVRFLSDYFRDSPRARVHLTDGMSLPAGLTGRADLAFSFGTFVMLKLGLVYSYAREFFRALKPGGRFVIEYIDISTPEGWVWLEAHSADLEPASTYTYFTPDVLEAVFTSVGFELTFRGFAPGYEVDHPWVFLAGRRPEAADPGP